MIIQNCPAANNFNVFGLDDKLCCYKYHKYCEQVETCVIKSIIKKLRQRCSECQWDRTLTEDECRFGEYGGCSVVDIIDELGVTWQQLQDVKQ